MKTICVKAVTALALLGVLAGSGWAQNLTTTQKGALGGGVLGAGTGAIVGAATHHPVAGTLIGAGVGAVGGGLIGHGLEQNENANARLRARAAANQRQINQNRAEIQQLKQAQSDSEDDMPAAGPSPRGQSAPGQAIINEHAGVQSLAKPHMQETE